MTAESKNGQLSKTSKSQNCYKNVIKTVSDQTNLIENEEKIMTPSYVAKPKCTQSDLMTLDVNDESVYYKSIDINGKTFSKGDYIPYYPKGNGCKTYKLGRIIAFKCTNGTMTILLKQQSYAYCDRYECLLVKEKKENKEITTFYLATHRAWKEVLLSTKDLCLGYECDENVSIVPILVEPTITV